MRIIALFNLRPGIAVADYETWARTADLPTVRALASVERFEVFRNTGQFGSDAPPPFAYTEIIDVADMARFGEEVATPAMQAVAAAFQTMAEVVFMTTEPL